MESVFRPDLFARKRVLVTGGSSGIGLAISQAFVRHGAHVVVLSRHADKLRPLARELGRKGMGGADFIAADVRDAEAIEKAAAEHDPMDVVVNGAAGNFPSPFAAMSANAWDAVVDIVLGGTVHVTRSFGERMLEAATAGSLAGASFVNIVAGYAWTGAPGTAHSGAAKAGVLNLTKSLAVEWAPHLRVNAVSPGPIADTEGMKRLGTDLGLDEAVVRAIPMARMGKADEVAQACLFLASPAASYVTGDCLVVDGGQDAMGPFGMLWQTMRESGPPPG